MPSVRKAAQCAVFVIGPSRPDPRLIVPDGRKQLRAAIDRVADQSQEVPQTLAKSYVGIALAINLLKLRVRVISGQQMIQKRSQCDLLLFGHVLQRTGSNILRL